MALAAYRHVLRGISIAFKGDLVMLNGARSQARQAFEQNRSVGQENSDQVAEQVKHAEDVATILMQNVVQGQQESENPDRYKLRIHEHTERGDNDTVKTPGQSQAGKVSCGGAA